MKMMLLPSFVSLQPLIPSRCHVLQHTITFTPLSSPSHLSSRHRRCILMKTTDLEGRIPSISKESVISDGKPVSNEISINNTKVNTFAGANESQKDMGRTGRDTVVTLTWVGIALAFAGGFYVAAGTQTALEFLTGYIIEYSLSVDNLFVFLLIFTFFKVNRDAQHRVLTYGIIGAMVMRGIMIVLGEALTQRFKAVTVGFAILLIYSAAKLIFEGDGEEEEDLEKNAIVNFARKLLPFANKYDGDKFFTNDIDGRRLATPLMLVLLSVELSDIIFALDSVPAVLGISNDTLVIYLSNILAIMGLRNLYFLIEDTIGGLRFLRPALAVVLGFVGGKMIAGVAGYEFGIVPSLAVVGTALGGGVGFSLAFPEKEELPRAEVSNDLQADDL